MKRIFTVLLSLSLSLSCLFLLTACDGTGTTAENGDVLQKESQNEESGGTDVEGEKPHEEGNDNQGGTETPHYTLLSTLYPWIESFKEEDILKVRTESAAIGVAPGHFRNIAYSTDREDIKNVYEKILLSSVKKVSESGEEGGGYVQYEIYTNDGTFTLTFSNKCIYADGAFYHFEEKLYTLCSASTECKAFITYADMTDMWDSFAVFTCGAESVNLGEFEGLSSFEFTEYTGECDMNVKLCLVSETVNLKMLSEKFFMIEGDQTSRVFEITGERDFSEFFNLASVGD